MNLEDLRAAQTRERATDGLQELRDSFYGDVAEYIEELKEQRETAAAAADDPFGDPEVQELTDKIETAEQVAEAIYERRMGKLVKQASLAAAGMPDDANGLTEEERDLYGDLVERIETNKNHVLDVISGDADTASGGDVVAGNSPGSAAASGDGSDSSAAAAMGDGLDDAEATGGTGAAGEQSASGQYVESQHDDPDDEPSGGEPRSDDQRGVEPTGDEPGPEDSGAGGQPADADPPDAVAEDLARVQSDEGDEDGGRSDGGRSSPSGDEDEPQRSGSSGDDAARSHTGGEAVADGESTADGGDGDVDRTRVRVTDDVGEIFGLDEREYVLEAEDVVTLPEENAAPLVERGAAEKLD